MRDHSSLDIGVTSNTSQSGSHIDLFLEFDGELDKSLNGLGDGNSTDTALRLRGGDNDRSSVDGKYHLDEKIDLHCCLDFQKC